MAFWLSPLMDLPKVMEITLLSIEALEEATYYKSLLSLRGFPVAGRDALKLAVIFLDVNLVVKSTLNLRSESAGAETGTLKVEGKS